MTNHPVADALKVVLADSYTLYLKTQNYHWNVEGPNFQSLHTLFQEQYEELAEAVDDIAERIRALGEKAPGSYSAFAKLSDIGEASGDENDVAMLQALYAGQKALVVNVKRAMEVAQTAEDEASFDLMVQRQQAHEKNAWMLRSSMPAEART